MQTLTLGRHATSQGVSDAVGKGGTVTVEVGECGYCQPFAGEAVVGQDPLPPYQPSSTCVASAARVTTLAKQERERQRTTRGSADAALRCRAVAGRRPIRCGRRSGGCLPSRPTR
jgi:hypothetical protein